ncbi:MAG: hypothetical protein JXA94_02705 [Parachlamydiales bacterium]|nr:hypothetical protein [Parachlamydiales bacterium]
MTALASMKKVDHFDLMIDFCVNARPRDLFKSLHHFIFGWNNYLTGANTAAIKNGLSFLDGVVNAFNIADLVENLNDFRNYLLGKKVINVSENLADITNNISETALLGSAANIVTFTASTMSWLNVISGATLAYSFTGKVVRLIAELNSGSKLSKDVKNFKLCQLAKCVSLFVMGIIIAISAWFNFKIVAPTMLVLSTIALVGQYGMYYYENKSKLKG